MINKIQKSFLTKPIIAVLIVALFNLSFAAPKGKVILKAGTPITVQLNQEISSENYSTGQVISARVMNDVKVDDKVVIPAGSPVKGQVVSVEDPKGVGKPGVISIMISSVLAVDGTQVQLSSTNITKEGEDKKALAWGLGAVGCITTVIGFVVMFFIKGEHGKIPAGMIIETNVSADTEIQLD